MIGRGGRVRALSAAGLAAVVAAGCSTSADVRLIEKSMEPAIRSGELVELDAFAYDDRDPRRGEIITFGPPAGVDSLTCPVEPAPGAPCGEPAGRGDGPSLIKRVIAQPGDTVAIDVRGRAIVNGETESGTDIIQCRPTDECELPEPITVPPGHLFVMGDNRPYSGDSRDFGPIEIDSVEGKVTPPER